MILALVLSCAGCASIKETAKEAALEVLQETKADLVAAGRDIAVEVRAQASLLATDLIAKGKDALQSSGGDIKAAVTQTLSQIPTLAAEAGQRAASEALAKRVEALEGKPKAEEFRRRAEDEGLPAALVWAAGGTGLTLLGYIYCLLRQRGVVQQAQAVALSQLDPAVRQQVQAAVVQAADGHPAARAAVGVS